MKDSPYLACCFRLHLFLPYHPSRPRQDYSQGGNANIIYVLAQASQRGNVSVRESRPPPVRRNSAPHMEEIGLEIIHGTSHICDWIPRVHCTICGSTLPSHHGRQATPARPDLDNSAKPATKTNCRPHHEAYNPRLPQAGLGKCPPQ